MVHYQMDNKEEVKYIASAMRRLHTLADKFAQALIVFEEQQATLEIQYDQSREIAEAIDRIEHVLIVLLDTLVDQKLLPKSETGQLREELLESRRTSLQRQIVKLQSEINELEEQSVEYGAFAPLELTNQLIRIKERRQEKQKELDDS